MTAIVEPIAVTGLDCRFPGAEDPAAFFDFLLRGGDAIATVPADRWDAEAYYSADAHPGHSNSRAGGFLADIESFDNDFFRISPAEAAAMDPQQRLLLQCAWRALEDSGIDPARAQELRTGVFVGIMGNEWAHLETQDLETISPYFGAGNGYGMIANRVSYHLNLTGPSMAVDSACSSSLLAVHVACQSLRSGECDRALVGTVNLALTPTLNIFYAQAGMSAKDGRCKPFSSGADGIGRGEGVAVVVLRRMTDADREGDPIYATIQGSATGHDGRSNGLTAPNRWAQVDVVRRAYAQAGVRAQDVSFIEAHGTGTVLGDMIEVKALGELHGVQRDRPCGLGTLKGNIGHVEAAAGLAGLIKVALSLDRGVVPPTICVGRENPSLRLAKNGLELIASPWPLPATAVAGVSSFGIGGTNVHVVIAGVESSRRRRGDSIRQNETEGGAVLTLSGSSQAAVRRNAGMFAAWLDDQPDQAESPGVATVGSICRTTNTVKAGLPWRIAIPADEGATLIEMLEGVAADLPDAAPVRRADIKPQLAFVFSGQGAHHLGMTAGLLAGCATYRRHLAEADASCADHVGRSLVDLLRSGDPALLLPRYFEPALFAVGYALGRTLLDAGITPRVFLGHSVGEYAAACMAGALTLDVAAQLVATRGALIDALPPGGAMVACSASPDEVRRLFAPNSRLSIAVHNGPRDVVVAGDDSDLDVFQRALAQAGIGTLRLDLPHAFHSHQMDQVLAPFAAVADTLPVGAAAEGFISTVTGSVVDTPLDGAYWTRQIREPVHFADAVATAVAQGVTHLIEVGPRPVLTGVLRRQLGASSVRCYPALSRDSDLRPLLASLYLDGLEPQWEVTGSGQTRAAVHLPGYSFDSTNRYSPRRPLNEVKPPTTSPLAASPAGSASTVGSAPSEAPTAQATPTEIDLGVRLAIARIGGYDLARVTPMAHLHDDLGLDSMLLIGLQHELELRFPGTAGVDVVTLLPHITTVAALSAFVASVVSAPASADALDADADPPLAAVGGTARVDDGGWR